MIEVAGGVVWNKQKGIVVVNQHNNSWSLPKGHVETGETTLHAATREIQEESGIPSSALTLVGKIAEYKRNRIPLHEGDEKEHRNITLYLFTTTWDKLAPEDADNPEARWVNIEDVPEMLTHPIDKSEFRRIITTGIFN